MNKNQTWRRVLTLICVMTMLIGIMVVGSVVASAEETDAAVLTYEVDTYEELIAALANDGAHVRMTADITATATQSSGYGKAGIVVGAGDVLDGNGKKLTINGAGGTWDCAIAMTGGEVKNLTIAGAMRGIFMPGANDDVVIDNCVFVNVIYTFNSDAGSKNHTVTIKNTKLNGWTSFSNVHKSVTFESCKFGKGSGYAFCRPYQATKFVDCDFAAGYELDNKNIPAADVLTFNNCTYAGKALSATNKAMFYNGGSVVIDGETTDVNPPKGSVTPAFTSATSIWGEGGGNAYESLVVELHSGDKLLATASLNNIDGIIDGDVYVSWNIPLNAAGNDEYWNVVWSNYITADLQPTKVVMVIDGVKVAENNYQLNSPDNLNKIVAASADADGKFTKYFTSLNEALAAVTDDAQTTVVLRDVTEYLTASLRGNITSANETTITLTNSDWVYCPYSFVIDENVTLNVPAFFYYASGSVIRGTVVAEAYYQRYAGTKLTIEAPGSFTVTSETCIIRYMDGDPNAGIYVIGDNDDTTVELKVSVAYFYQGMINAKDATIEVGVYWQTNETDGQGSANLVLDNSVLNVLVNEHDFKATGNSTVTLKNSSSVEAAGNIVLGDNTELSVDASSSLKDKNGEVQIPVASVNGVKYTSLQDAFKAATDGCTIEILADVTIDGKWDCRDYATGGSHSQFKESVTINGNRHTIKFVGTVSDNNWNTIFRFEENATVTNLTVDISEATGAQRVISAKKSLTVDRLTIIGNAKYGIIFGEGSSAADFAAAEIVIKNSTLTGTRRAISDNEGGKDVKSVVITGNTLKANVYVSASESITFNNNTTAGEVDLRSYAAENVLSVEAKGNTLTEGVKNYILAKSFDAQDEFDAQRPAFKVSTKAELNAALAAAQEGDTIVLTADIDYGTDQLALTKAITLDLGGKTLTTRNAWGGMSVKGNATVKNGTIVHASTVAAIKVWNATAFEDLVIDVQGKGDANKVIGGIVLQSGSTTRVGSIKNVTIKGVALTNGIETYNCGDATENVIGYLEDVTIDSRGVGLNISAPVGTATNCTIKGDVNGIEIWIKGNYSASLDLVNSKVEGGVYAHDEFSSNPDIVNNGTLSLTVSGTTLDDITLTLARAKNVAGVLKDIKDNAQAKVNNVYYATLAEAMAAAKSGDTVTILEGNYTGNLSVNKAITVVGEGTVKFNGKLSITANGATVKNLNFTNSGTACYVNAKDVTIDGCTLVGSNGLYQSYTTGKVTIKNSTITGGTYGVNFDGSTGGEIVIEGCTITGWTSFAKAIKKVTITDTTFENGSYNFVRFYQENVVIDGCTFNKNMKVDFAVDGANVTVTDTTLENGNVENLFSGSDMVNSTITVDGVKLVRVAKIGNTHYATLEEALAAVADWTTIKLVANATLNYGAREAYGRGTTTDIIIDGQGFTLTLNQTNSDWSSIGMVNANGKLTLKNMTIEKTGYGDTTGAWNTHAIIFSCNVEMNNVTVKNSVAVQNGATLKNVTINEANEFYGLWINGNGQTVTANGLTINATNKGRGIKIADQYIDAPVSVTLNLSNATFNTAKKAAVLVTSTAGANITASNVNISNVVADTVNFVWVDSDRAEYYGNVTVTGATKGQEDVNTFVASVAKNGNVIGYYTTIADAIAAAKAGETVELLADVTESAVVLINKSVTINGNGHKVTSSATRVFRVTVGNVKVTLNDVNMVNTAVRVGTADIRGISIDDVTGVELTLNNCSVDFTDASATDWSYAVNVVGGSDHTVNIDGGTYEAANVINIRGEGQTVVVKNATLTSLYPDNDVYYGACIYVVQNANSSVVAEGNTFNGTNAIAFNVGDTHVTESNNTDNTALIVAKIGNTYYTSLADAFAAAQDGETITLLHNITLDVSITNTKNVTLDLNGKTITGTDNATGSFGLINNKGTLTITGNGKITLTATNERNWNAYSSVISNQVGGKLVVKSGTIEHLGGTAMAYAIDNLTNGKGTYAETVINGGTIKSTYRAIRQFLNGVEAENILTVNGGTVEGANKAIWMQDPSKNANTGTLTVGANAVINGDIYLFVTAGSTEWPVTVSIAASAVNGEVLTGNVPSGLTVKNVNGVYVVAEGLNGSGTAEDPYLINCVADLVWLQKEVDKQASDGSTQFAGKYFKLTADLDLAGINWNPIGSMSGDHGSFLGIFDGGNHTISNLYVEQAGNGLGLFARTAGNAVIKNLNLQNVTVKSTDNSNYVGGLVGNAYASTKIENVHVTGDVYISGRGYIGGIAGHGYVVMDNVSVVANEGSIVTSTFWCAGGILGYAGEGTTNIMNARVEGLTITSAAGGLGAIVGMAEDNKGTQPISGSNLSAKNVKIKTYVGAYGTAYENYAIGYLYGGNETSKLTGVLSVENVTLTNASGKTPNVVDAVATANGVVYFNLQEAIKAAAPDGTVELLRDTTVDEWKMITTKTIATGQLITLTINGLTIDGNEHTLTIKDVESAGNGGYLFDDAKNLTIKNLTINQPAGCGGIGLKSGTIENVTINGGWYGVVPGSEGVTITGCTFKGMVKHAIYIDEARNGIVITGNTFNTASGAYATIMYGTEKFTNNTIVTGRVNLTNSSSATVSGNDFGTERFKVYNGSTAIITNNKINNLVFNDPTDFVESTFTNNTLSTDAQAAIDALPTPVAKIGNVKYKTLAEAIAAAQSGDTVTVFAGTYAMPSMKAGITLEGVGNVMFEGTLSGTLENLTLKNIHIKGSNAQRWAYAKGNLVFENVTFEATSIYALHFDGIAEGTNLLYKDCTIIGWAAMGGTPASCVFEGCTFKGNGTYGVIRTYFNATIKDCTFDVANVNTNDAYQDGINAVSGAKVTVTNCTNANGKMEDIVKVNGTSVVTVDGKEIKNVAIVGGNYYTSLQAAIEAAADLYLQDKNQVPVIKLFADCAENVHIGDHDKHVDLTLALDLNGKAYTGTVSLNNGSALIAPNTISVKAIPVGSGLTYVFDRWVATNHQLNGPVVVPPTCVAQGYTVYKCSQPGCDVEFRGNYVAVNPNNHNYVAGTVVAPTVNTQGYTVYTCSYCGNSENRDFKPVLVAVAEINGTKYATLQAAIDAVQTGETVTIKLISDINYDGSEAFEGGKFKYSILHLVHGQEITIDFNGHKINVEITKQPPVLTGNLLVSVFFVEYGANVTFVDNSTEGNGGIYAKKSQVDNVILYCLIYNASATVTIESGNYVAEEVSDSLVYADKVNNTYIKGGFFNVMNYTQAKPWVSNVEGKNKGNFVVYTGGTFNHDPLVNRFSQADCEVYIPNGYAVVKNENGTWSVIEAAAKVGDEYFKTLAEAMAYCNKNAGIYTIELIDNVDEVITFAQKAGVEITINGNNEFTFTGMILLEAGAGTLRFNAVTITPTKTHTFGKSDQKTSVGLLTTTAPDLEFVECKLQGVNRSGSIVYGYESYTSNTITVTKSTASDLQYIISFRQSGSKKVVIDDVTATNMTYVLRTLKCSDVYVKKLTATDVVMGIQIKNDVTGTLTLEDVTIDICAYTDGTYSYPVGGNGAGKTFNIVLKGANVFLKDGEAAYKKTEWFDGNAGYKVILIDSINGNLNFKEDIGFTFTFNTEYALRKGYVAVITVAGETYEIPATKWNGNKVTINLFAKQMTDEITVVVKWGDREVSDTITTSVRAYYEAGVKANRFSAKDLELLNAVLHYGAAAQKAFGYNTDKLAHVGVDAPANATVKNDLVAERYFGSTLNLDSHIVFNFKFLRDSLDVAYAKVNGKEYKVSYETNASVGQLVVVKVDDLYITDANELLTCTLYDAQGNELRTAKDSVTSYCARAITGLTNLKNSNETAYNKQALKEDFYQALANYVNALSVYRANSNTNTNEGGENS